MTDADTAIAKLAKRTHMVQTGDINSPNLTIYFSSPDDMNDAADALRDAFFARAVPPILGAQ